MDRPPRFTTGARLGGYEILALLGAGGMGEVYRARDEKLSRDVAIKILSDPLTADAAHLARFEREARILASLNHPNIGAIYGSIESDGVRALVLEIVEGQTLADQLPMSPRAPSPATKRLSLDDSLRIARQIAEALEAAHERGIVHRDLKPANIKVNPAGVVKVLDFGIAKITDATDGDATAAATMPAPTREGTAIGTAPYMSPEQARGLAVDTRCDIWAFGCVLYELVADRQAFSGETLSDTIAAVLTRDPDWAALPPALPTRIRDLLRRCLKKDLRSRLQHIGDARIEIDETLAAVPGDPSSGTLAVSPSPTRRFAPSLLTAVVVAAATLPAGWMMATYRADGADPAFGRVIRLISTAAHESGPAISPDGKWVAYLSNARGPTDVWVKFIAGGDAINLTADKADLGVQSQTNLTGLEISPEGSRIAFAASSGQTTWVIPAPTGGVPRKILPEGHQGLRWSPNGQQMVYFAGGGPLGDNIILADGDGQNPREIVKRAGARHIHWLRWAPDGRFVYFNYGAMNGNTEGTEIFRASIPDGRLEPVVRTARRAVFPVPSPDGRGLFYAANPDSLDLGLWWRDLDSNRDVRVTTGVGEYAEAAISIDGQRIVGTVLDVRQSLERVAVRFDQPVALEPVTDGFTGDFDPAWFPDGGRMVLSSSRTGQRNIWITAAGSPAAPITTGASIDERPVVSPDGTHIAFVSDRGGRRGIWTVSASGGAPRLASAVDVIDTISWSPDGERLVYSTPGGNGPALAILSLADGRSTALSTPAAATAPAWAPRGDVIAYVEPRGGPAGAVLKFVGADGRSPAIGPAEEVKVNNGVVAWSPDARRLAVATIVGSFGTSLSIVELEGVGRVRKLTNLPDDVRPRGLTWNPDGTSLTIGIVRASGDIFLAERTR